jgi:hypothetical protein
MGLISVMDSGAGGRLKLRGVGNVSDSHRPPDAYSRTLILISFYSKEAGVSMETVSVFTLT